MTGSTLRWLLTNVMGQNPSVQQLSLIRKLIYLGLILVLFTVSYFFRTVVAEGQAADLALRDRDVGEVELTGSALRLSLTGLRGLATCVIWVNAMDKFKKGQWEELDLLTTSATKLQPHFNTPWQFQSWNLAFNVVNQCDRPGDKFFYIARGVQLLADGERQNRFDPELPFAIGRYYDMRMGTWEYAPIMQTLVELSCIDPQKRDANWLKEANPEDPNGGTNFETSFCKSYPRLVRRLRQPITPRIQKAMASPEEVFRFFEENRDIPALYTVVQSGGELRTERKRNKDNPFPVFPQENYNPELAPVPKYMTDPDRDLHDVHLIAKAWYLYAQEPLPDPIPERPGSSDEKQLETDPIHKRIPKHMTTLIFRDYPARTQSYVAEDLAKEGWFDKDGWLLTWESPGQQPILLGTGIDWGRDSWQQAYEEWRRFGERNGINLPAEKIQELNAQAELYRRKYRVHPGMYPHEPQDPDPAVMASFAAHDRLHWYGYYRHLINYAHHFQRAQVEQEDATVAARKALYEAQQAERRGSTQAISRFEDALAKWRDVLAAHPTFAADSNTQEATQEYEKKYIEAFHRTPFGERMKEWMQVEAAFSQATSADLGLMLSESLCGPPPDRGTAGQSRVLGEGPEVEGKTGRRRSVGDRPGRGRAWVGALGRRDPSAAGPAGDPESRWSVG